jgi:type II secretory pathway component PulF
LQLYWIQSISIDETLKSIALEVEDKSLSAALHSVRDEILQGSRIAEAMSSHPSIFNETYRSLVAAGDAAGNLHIAFSNLADYLEESALGQTASYFGVSLSYDLDGLFSGSGFCSPNICHASSC